MTSPSERKCLGDSSTLSDRTLVSICKLGEPTIARQRSTPPLPSIPSTENSMLHAPTNRPRCRKRAGSGLECTIDAQAAEHGIFRCRACCRPRRLCLWSSDNKVVLSVAVQFASRNMIRPLWSVPRWSPLVTMLSATGASGQSVAQAGIPPQEPVRCVAGTSTWQRFDEL